MKKSLWTVIGISLAVVIVFVSVAYYVANNFKEESEITTKSPIAQNTKVDSMISLTTNQQNTINEVHHMANVVIHAKDNLKFGELDPSPQTLDRIIEIIEKDEGFLADILTSLKEWRKGNFVNVVEVHNNVWDILGGTIGRAYKPDNDAIKSLKNKYNYNK